MSWSPVTVPDQSDMSVAGDLLRIDSESDRAACSDTAARKAEGQMVRVLDGHLEDDGVGDGYPGINIAVATTTFLRAQLSAAVL